jgi:hypothetical protein
MDSRRSLTERAAYITERLRLIVAMPHRKRPMNWHDIDRSALLRHTESEMNRRTISAVYYYPDEVGTG